ncbi:SPOR domain-containing protein [bacterium]|nr:SPOR domain-containing protein [bacterium]
MKKYLFIFISVVLIGIWGCAASKFGWETEPKTDQPTTESKTGFTEDFDPLSLNEEDIRVSPLPPDERQPDTRVIQSESDEAETIPESELVSGYRVQLSASTDEQNAFEAKKRAIYKFNRRVYLVFQAPYYKLYVGDFLKSQKKEADALAEKARKMGFQDAWTTPARVNPQNTPDTY